MKIPQKYLSRQAEITALFLQVMHAHMDDFMAGRALEMLHLKHIASVMCLHPVHVSNVVKLHTGWHPCHFYELRIVHEAKLLLADSTLPISEIAGRLTYDTSNFTKFFKKYAGMTPTNYRRQLGEPVPDASFQAARRPPHLRLAA